MVVLLDNGILGNRNNMACLGVFIGDRFLGKDWEEKKIKEYMEREKRNR